MNLTFWQAGICEPAPPEDAALPARGLRGVPDQAEHDVLHPEQDDGPRERGPRPPCVRQSGQYSKNIICLVTAPIGAQEVQMCVSLSFFINFLAQEEPLQFKIFLFRAGATTACVTPTTRV